MITPSSTLTRVNNGNYSRLTFMMDNGVFWYFDRSGLDEVRGGGFQKVEGGCWDFVGEFFGVVSKVEWCV